MQKPTIFTDPETNSNKTVDELCLHALFILKRSRKLLTTCNNIYLSKVCSNNAVNSRPLQVL